MADPLTAKWPPRSQQRSTLPPSRLATEVREIAVNFHHIRSQWNLHAVGHPVYTTKRHLSQELILIGTRCCCRAYFIDEFSLGEWSEPCLIRMSARKSRQG